MMKPGWVLLGLDSRALDGRLFPWTYILRSPRGMDKDNSRILERLPGYAEDRC
jgi:hypothetical protein